MNAVGPDPLMITLRYRCECHAKETLQIGMVVDMNLPEEMFVMTVKQMWRDMKTEVAQHVNVRPASV